MIVIGDNILLEGEDFDIDFVVDRVRDNDFYYLFNRQHAINKSLIYQKMELVMRMTCDHNFIDMSWFMGSHMQCCNKCAYIPEYDDDGNFIYRMRTERDKITHEIIKGKIVNLNNIMEA